MKISVAMATYNGARFLQEQLDSLVHQTRIPDELVVTDDGSTDETMRILAAFQSRAPFEVKVISNAENMGFSRNFEKALVLSAGEVILFSDQDDVWERQKVSTIEHVFSSTKEVFVTINDQFISPTAMSHTGITMLGNFRAAGQSEASFVAGCCTALRASWRDLVLPIPHKFLNHDEWINLAAHYLDVRRLIDEPLQYYRRHSETVTSGVLSQPRKLGWNSRLSWFALSDERSLWKSEELVLLQLADKLANRREVLARLGILSRLDRALGKLRRRSASLEERVVVNSERQPRRFVAGWRMLRKGLYGEFRGARSFVKDMIR